MDLQFKMIHVQQHAEELDCEGASVRFLGAPTDETLLSGKAVQPNKFAASQRGRADGEQVSVARFYGVGIEAQISDEPEPFQDL